VLSKKQENPLSRRIFLSAGGETMRAIVHWKGGSSVSIDDILTIRYTDKDGPKFLQSNDLSSFQFQGIDSFSFFTKKGLLIFSVAEILYIDFRAR
jgi:hypothetical protein